MQITKPRIDPHLLMFCALLALLTGLVLAQANPGTTIPGRDSGFFLYAGSRLLAGDRLYVDIWDHKGPGIFVYNALGQLLVRNSRWGVWFLEYLSIYGAFLSGYLAVKKQWGSGAALAGTGLGLLVLNQVLVKGNLTEEYPLLYNFIALALFFHAGKKDFLRYFLIGVSFGLAFMFRANNGGSQVAIGLTVLILGLAQRKYRETFTNLAAIALGGLSVAALTGLYFYSLGTFNDFITGAFTYNFLDVEAKGSLWNGFLEGVGYLHSASLVLFAAYLSALYAAYTAIFRRTLEWGELRAEVLILVLWPLEILLSSLSGRSYIHYYICWTPFAFLAGSYAYHRLAGHVFAPKALKFLDSKAVMALVLAAGLLAGRQQVLDYSTAFQRIAFDRQNGIDAIDKVSLYIRENTEPSQTVFVWGGQAGINFMSRRKSPTRYTFYPSFPENPMTASIADGFFQDLQNDLPELIVDTHSKNPDNLLPIDPGQSLKQQKSNPDMYFPPNTLQVLAYINEHYVYETTIDKFQVYRLKK